MDDNSSEKNVPVSKNYQENVNYLNRELGVPDNFDIVLREMSIGGKRVAIYSINGMVDSHVASYILDALIDLERSDLIVNALDKLVMVKKIQKDIQAIKIDGIPMAEKSVEEFILGSKFWNPYPRVRYTERPDVAAIHLLQGYVVIIVDTSPSVMIAPATFWSHVQHAEEYRQEPIVGAYLRWIRFGGIFAALFLLPLWLGAALNPQLLPDWLQFIGLIKPTKIPLLFQVLIAEFGVDLLRMATIHTPGPLGSALGIIAAFMLGDIAVKVGLFSPEVVMYVAIAAVGTYATPSYELGLANRLSRLFLILMTGLFNFIGFGIGAAMVFFLLWRTKSFGVPYLWPLLPLDVKAMWAILVRSPVPIQDQRPSILKPQDSDRQPEGNNK